MITKDNIVTTLKQCIGTLENRQSKQTIDYSSIVEKRYNSGNSYDYAVSTAPGETKKFTLTATPKSGRLSMTNLSWWYRIAYQDVLAYPMFAFSNAPSVMVSFVELIPQNGANRYSFKVYHISTDDTIRVAYFKFIFASSDEVTWTIT